MQLQKTFGFYKRVGNFPSIGKMMGGVFKFKFLSNGFFTAVQFDHLRLQSWTHGSPCLDESNCMFFFGMFRSFSFCQVVKHIHNITVVKTKLVPKYIPMKALKKLRWAFVWKGFHGKVS